MNMGMDLRHSSQIKGGFVINETELLCRATPEGAEVEMQYVYSNLPSIVDEHRPISIRLWNMAIRAPPRSIELNR